MLRMYILEELEQSQECSRLLLYPELILGLELC